MVAAVMPCSGVLRSTCQNAGNDLRYAALSHLRLPSTQLPWGHSPPRQTAFIRDLFHIALWPSSQNDAHAVDARAAFHSHRLFLAHIQSHGDGNGILWRSTARIVSTPLWLGLVVMVMVLVRSRQIV